MSTRKLLLADDSITIQKVVNLTFADEGIEVISVSNGDAAIEKLAEIAPDLVMADVSMPGLSGYQVCERIKQDEKFRQTPVILLVGSFEPFDEEEAKRVGADDFLTKPFQSIRQLVNKVTVLLDAHDNSAAQLYEATANNSFADTLDMEKSEIMAAADSTELGDAGMDDEMIQTSDVRSFALDESAKFETKEVFETFEDKKTQPLSVYDLKEFSFVASKDSAENAESADSQNSEEKSPAFSEFYDDDLLEIPYDEEDEPLPAEETAPEQAALIDEESESGDTEEKREFTDEVNSAPETLSEDYRAENEIVVGSLTESVTSEETSGEHSVINETQTVSESPAQFSPELIEAVAQRVIEKLSDSVVREIAWEVVPQHVDLIVKKMVEEKLKE